MDSDRQATNAAILAQLALLGTEQNRLADFLIAPERGEKLVQGLVALDPAQTGFKPEDVYAAARGLALLTESLLDHLIARHRGNERIKNLSASGNLLLALRAGPPLDRKSLNRLIGTFYLDWPFAAHFSRDLYRLSAGGLTVFALVFGGLQKLRDLLDEQSGLA
jgi:hypothetical protein